MSLTLMEVDDLRARVETSLTDDQLEQLGSDCEAAITEWAGQLVYTGDPEAVDEVTETAYAHRQTLLRLRQTPAEIVSVTDTTGSTDTELVSDNDTHDYRIRGDYLERANYYLWGERTVVVYKPADARWKRRQALVKLVQLELNFEPGVTAQQAGPWAERYSEYVSMKREILNDVYQPEWFA